MKTVLIRLIGDTYWNFGVMVSSTGSVEDFFWNVALKLRLLTLPRNFPMGGAQHGHQHKE